MSPGPCFLWRSDPLSPVHQMNTAAPSCVVYSSFAKNTSILLNNINIFKCTGFGVDWLERYFYILNLVTAPRGVNTWVKCHLWHCDCCELPQKVISGLTDISCANLRREPMTTSEEEPVDSRWQMQCPAQWKQHRSLQLSALPLRYTWRKHSRGLNHAESVRSLTVKFHHLA